MELFKLFVYNNSIIHKSKIMLPNPHDIRGVHLFIFRVLHINYNFFNVWHVAVPVAKQIEDSNESK